MLPDQVLSSTALPQDFLNPREIAGLCEEPPVCGDPGVHDPLDNYEVGGVDFNDSSQGLNVKLWRGQLVGDSITLSADGVTPLAVVTEPLITEFQFSFDQNMRPFICYVADGSMKFYWFDTQAQEPATTVLGGTVTDPRCALDDKRALQVGTSDIILAYIRTGALYFRAQRDRYTIEYPLLSGVERLVQVGMNRGLRFQFRIKYAEV